MEALGFHHALVRSARALHERKHRSEQRSFLIEGPTAIAAALSAPGLSIERVFVRDAGADGDPLLQQAHGRGISICAVDERTMRALSQTREPQGVVAVARFFHRPIEELRSALTPEAPCLALVLHAISDPGNAGTLVRSAEAFGAAALCWGAGSVDPYNDKVVRASMGSLFHLPLFWYENWQSFAAAAGSAGLAIVGAEAGAPDVRSVTAPARAAVAIGNERHGLRDLPAGALASRVGIPQRARAESLNAAVAGSIVLYEIARSTGVLDAASARTSPP